MSTTKTLITLPGPHFAIWETPLPTAEVLARLDEALNKKGAEGIIQKVTQEMKTQQELLDKVQSITEGHGDIMYFNTIPMHSLTALRTATPNPPLLVLYTLGNPVIAQRIIKVNPLAAANIPPRMVVAENEDRSGTRLAYNLPSSVMTATHPFTLGVQEDEELRNELVALDAKFEELLIKVTKV